MGRVIPQINRFATEINAKVFGRQTARPVAGFQVAGRTPTTATRTPLSTWTPTPTLSVTVTPGPSPTSRFVHAVYMPHCTSRQ